MIGQGSRQQRYGGIATGLLLSCALALGSPGVAGAQPPGHTDLPDAMPADRLLVSHRSPTGMELHTIDPDGGDRTVLTAGSQDFAGVWSPDGRHIAFNRVEAGGSGLWVVPSDGGSARRLADGGHTPSWAPDSTRIIHSPSTEGDPVPLAVTDLAGVTTQVPDSAGGIDPVWSPDGRQIAYVDPGRDFALVMSHVDGTDRTVTPGPAAGPTWSPGSDRVAYVDQQDDRARLWLIDGAASAGSVLTEGFARIQQLAFSPAGTHVAFAAAEQAGDPLDIWTVRVEDGQLQQVTDTPEAEFGPTWSASTGLIAVTRTPDMFAGDSPKDVVIVPGDGGSARQVTDSGTDHAVAFAPGLTLRLAGHDRIATAVALSRTYGEADTAVITRADDHADALTAAPLAAMVGGPILLTGGDGLDPSVAVELGRLGTREVILLGGHDALSPQVEHDLAAAGIDDVTRLAGTDRFGTAARVLDHLDVLGADIRRILIAEGDHADPARGWPDALSAAGVAAHTLDPILLVTRDRVPAETASALQVHPDVRATVVGGSEAVSEAVVRQIDDAVGDVERLSGPDRYATSALAADLAVADGASAAHPWLVTGGDWPDALVAAPAAARDGGVLLLVDGGAAIGSAASHAWLSGREVLRGVVVGGTGSLTPPVRAAIESSLTGGP